jgi:hypothetical protein
MAKRLCKRSWRLIWPLGAALALGSIVATGCDSDGSPFITSLQPFYTRQDLEADSRLNGIWGDKEGDVTFSFEERKEEGKEEEYKLVVEETDGEQKVSGEFEARVVRLGAFYFLDIYPQSRKEGNEFYRAHFARAHTIARVEISQDSIQMAFLSASWLKAKMEEKSVDTPCMEVDDTLMLTGTTKEVQELVFSHANDDGAFADSMLLEKQRIEKEEQ